MWLVLEWMTKGNISYGDCTTIGNYVLRQGSLDIMSHQPPSENGVILKAFSRLTQKGSSVAHSPYDIYYIYTPSVLHSIMTYRRLEPAALRN